MIKIKILEHIQQDGKTYITLMWSDGTILPYKFEGYISKEDAVHDTYIIGQHMPRQQFTGEIPTTAEDWEPNPTATKLEVKDWNNLTAKIYDQYGAEMEVEIQFSIEGENAKIEGNKIIEDVVDTDTSYFIVAKYGNLEERQERTICAPVEPRPNEVETLNNKIAKLEEVINAMLVGGI